MEGEAGAQLEINLQMPVMVSVDAGRRLGHEIRQPGADFELRNVCGDQANYLGSDGFNQVYFRTDSGNIYRIDELGQIVNANECSRQGAILGRSLSDSERNSLVMMVGTALAYGGTGKTTVITEIVPVSGRAYEPEQLASLTEGRTSKIIEDFNARMPKPATGAQGPSRT